MATAVEPISHEGAIREVEILDFDRMCAVSGISPAYLQQLLRHDQIQPLVHACSGLVQVGGPEEEAKAKQAARDKQAYIPRWRIMTAEERFREFLDSPLGLSRFKSAAHMAQMQNLVRGYPADYRGPRGDVLVSDSVMADIRHDVDKGKPIKDATLERVAPQLVAVPDKDGKGKAK